MKIYTIAEITNLVGTAIPVVQVTINKLWPVKSGQGAHGAWSFQTGEVSDSSGSMKLSLSNREPLPFNIGDQIFIQSVLGNKGLAGVMVTKEEFQNKAGEQVSQLALKVTKQARITVFMASEAPVAQEAVKPLPQQPNNQVIALKEVLKGNTGPVLKLAERINQYGDVYDKCFERASKIMGDKSKAEDTRTVATAFFIQACRDGLLEQVEAKEMATDDIPF